MAVASTAPLSPVGHEASEREQRLIEIFAAHADVVFATCYGILRDRDEAADASQETFIRALRSIASVPDEPRPWLRVVARNYCYDVLRSRRRQAALAAGLARALPTTTNPEAQALDRITLNRALGSLKPRDREALWSALVEELPMPEVARRLGLSYMGAAQVVHRAKQRALKLLRDVGAVLAPLLRWDAGTEAGAGRAAAVIAGVLLPALVVIGAGTVPDGSAGGGNPSAQRPAPAVAVPAAPPAAQAPIAPDAGADRDVLRAERNVAGGLPGSPDAPALPDLPNLPDLPDLPGAAGGLVDGVTGTAGGLVDSVTGTVGSVVPPPPSVPDVGKVVPPLPLPIPSIPIPPLPHLP
jgi:RNA polymerase sigma-70 factor (ECF subfamily)